MYEKIRKMVKPVEFLIMMLLPVIGCIVGGLTIKWALIIMVSYSIIQLTGLATKNTQDVIDGAKEEVEDIKKDIDRIKK
jgi:hypothetical protein